jgi:hypothetical protein
MKTLQNLRSEELERDDTKRYTAHHQPADSGGDEKEKGVLKFVSLSVILLLFSICYTKQLSDAGGIKAASSELVSR